ncbi:uncharacterized protein LOC125664001 [Ostrea edulis]|uniref:uncharacterized protein LOC125664001 n=1 Tax=Ostrea edulis TaxID=37623 RepID=UPI0024AF2F09|nr:uncharacterized protein LOC125664001 [Ostrea edulis]
MYFVLFCNNLCLYTLNTRSIKLSKGSILQAAVQCFKDLKKDKENLETLEAKQKTMDSKYQKMQLRTFRLELTTKLYELSEELDFIFVKNKSKPRMRHCEINDLVDELMKLGTPFKLKTDKCSTDSPFNEDAIQHVSHKEKTTKLQATKSILRDLIMKILSKKKQSRLVRKQEKAGQQEKIGRLKVQSRKHENEAAPQTRLEKHSMPDTISDELLTTDTFHLHSLSTNINYGECDILLDLFGSQSPHETAGQMETDPALPTHSSKQLFSTVTSPLPTTNMLEVLLKRSDKTPLQANSMESSLDSTL